MYVGDGIAVCGIAFSIMGVIITQIRSRNANGHGKESAAAIAKIHCDEHSGVCADIKNIKENLNDVKKMVETANSKLDQAIERRENNR